MLVTVGLMPVFGLSEDTDLTGKEYLPWFYWHATLLDDTGGAIKERLKFDLLGSSVYFEQRGRRYSTYRGPDVSTE